MLFYFLIYIGIINLITFFLYGIDKYKARKNRWRIPERTLILFALFGGSPGALLAMRVFHHKTRHTKFFLGVPIILILQITLGLLIFYLHTHGSAI